MGRQYSWRFKCPYCGRPYAKKSLWVRHIAACPQNPKREVNHEDRRHH